MITEVGYDTEFPQIDFLTVATRRVRNALRSIFCCSRGFEEAKVPLLGTRRKCPLSSSGELLNSCSVGLNLFRCLAIYI